MSRKNRLPFELDDQIDDTLITAHAGIPLLAELFRSCGAAEVMDRRAWPKQRQRGLTAAQTAESLVTLWVSGGERCEDLDRLRRPGLGATAGVCIALGPGAAGFPVRVP